MISNSNSNSDYLVEKWAITKTSQEKLFDVKMFIFSCFPFLRTAFRFRYDFRIKIYHICTKPEEYRVYLYVLRVQVGVLASPRRYSSRNNANNSVLIEKGYWLPECRKALLVDIRYHIRLHSLIPDSDSWPQIGVLWC
jgi:hypothetical protein